MVKREGRREGEGGGREREEETSEQHGAEQQAGSGIVQLSM